MTSKERLINAIMKKEVDRLPFWPGATLGLIELASWLLRFQGKPELDLDEVEIADYLGADLFYKVPDVFNRINNSVAIKTSNNDGEHITVVNTPDGPLTKKDKYGEDATRHPTEYLIKSRKDLQTARHLYGDVRFSLNRSLLANGREKMERIEERGVAMADIGTSPLMVLIQEHIGLENSCYFLNDYQSEMDELMQLMHAERKRHIRLLLEKTPYEMFVTNENTSTTLLSPDIFKKYCRKHLDDYGSLIKAHGKYHIIHMCGHLKGLLPQINLLPADGIESFNTPPVGNTTLADGFCLCPAKSLIGGINAILWLKDIKEIFKEIEKSIEEAGSILGLILGSGGSIPPSVPLEKIREVGRFVKNIRWNGGGWQG